MPSRRRGPARAIATVVGAAVALVLAACGDSTFRYVSNQDEQVFFRIPEGWQVFDEEDIFALAPGEVASAEAERTRERLWVMGFDSSEDPSVDHVLQFDRDDPGGVAEVWQLTASERDAVSLAVLRSFRLGFDPLQAAQQGQPVEVLRLEDVALDSGAHGVRLVITVGPEGSRAVIDQTALVDAETTRLYRFAVGCREACYEDHEDLLTAIGDSWTLEDPT